MSDTVIKVENLSKKYIIRHQQAQQYTALRDVIADGVKSIGRHLSGSKQDLAMGSTQEEFWALKDVSFEVKQGDRIGIIGRNGAGKSTLLKILSRIVEPTLGEVTLNGRVASLLEVGTGFHPELTGRENIFLNGAILGMSRLEISKNFDEIVEFSEVEKFLDTPVKRYSSGMYVRLAFAVAAHLEPEILIVDEVLAVGDGAFQKKCLGKMGEVAKEGRTVIFVSHNMQAIRRLCSSAIYFSQGKVEEVSTVEEAIQIYSSQESRTNYCVDLNSIPRKNDFGEKARLLSLRLSQGTEFSYGKPLSLIFTINCFQKIDNLLVGIGFDNITGSRVMTLDSDHDQPPLNIGTGLHDINFYLDRNPLHPGFYSIAIALHSNTYPLDAINDTLTWESTSSSSDLVGDRGYGGCRLPVKICVSRLTL
ncbi:ABC transporter ATP-binding protein [Altericista sp. CCNU0014]|uniref:ABC transporter ATP-binding protein n=1 Tax=Altericista sp. CCNU0014 TaxID=3082949 RepID=UPI00384F4339